MSSGEAIAGLALGALALAPPTLTLLDFWKRFFADARWFKNDADRLSLEFARLSLKYRSLQSILFDRHKFPFIPEDTLFENLENDNQVVILSILKELPRILYRYYQVEKNFESERTYAKILDHQDQPDLQLSIVLTPDEMRAIFEDGQQPEPRLKYKLLSTLPLKWAASSRKRAWALLEEYEKWLYRVEDTLKMTWWPLDAFSKFDNLRAVEHDKDCRNLSLATAAGLRKLLVKDAPLDDIVPQETDLPEIERFDDAPRGLCQLSDRQVFVEILHFQPDETGFLTKNLKARFQEISSLLNRVDDTRFHVLHCQTYAEILLPNPQFQLVFEVPSSLKGQPISLKRLIDSAKVKPSLDSRIRLCVELANSLGLFHSVGWIHRSLRSENVLFFGDEGSNKHLHYPYICGFEACRPEGDVSTGPYDDIPERNVYRHPNRWGTPRKSFTQSHDIYALGVVLLEIGLWQTVTQIKGIDLHTTIRNAETHPERGTAPEVIRQKIMRQARDRLGHKCGELFRSVTVECLNEGSRETPRGAFVTQASGNSAKSRLEDTVITPLKQLQDALLEARISAEVPT